MSKKKRPISEKEKARRAAAAAKAQEAAHGEPAPDKIQGQEAGGNLAKARIIRHQSRG
jgi:hypothetical protein